MRRLRRVGVVVFDCDSTLSAIEGIERLARGDREEVERLTEAAMNGELPLEAVYGRRLELVRPSRADVHQLVHEYIAALVPDARDVVAALLSEGISVRVISGGLAPAVVGLAKELGIEESCVAAVDVRFDEHDDYAGFDEASPLTRSSGKAELLAAWRIELGGPIMLVGDGVTDLEASPVVDVFVAYTGVVERLPVVAGADVVVDSRSLAPVLPLALAGEPPRNADARALYEKGLGLLEAEYRASLPYAPSTEM